MSAIMAIQCYPAGNAFLKLAWPYFQNSGVDEFLIVGTNTGDTYVPDGASGIRIGKDSYLDAEHLPLRLVQTLEQLIDSDHDILVISEHDVLFFAPIPFERMTTGTAGHLAGRKPWGAIGDKFYHNPHVWARVNAEKFVVEARRVIDSGVCKYGSPESSPDVFFGLVNERLGQEVQENLFVQFSRNSLDCEGDLERARLAYRSGFACIHGAKSKSDLEYITGVGITQEEDCTA